MPRCETYIEADGSQPRVYCPNAADWRVVVQSTESRASRRICEECIDDAGCETIEEWAASWAGPDDEVSIRAY